MSIDSRKMFAAWVQLSTVDQAEVIKLINTYQRASLSEKNKIAIEHLNESERGVVRGTTMNFGPAPGTCPACGR